MIAAITLPELAPILTIFVGMLGGFYALIKFILKQSEHTSAADRAERQALATAVERMAVATERTAKEAEQRNGHLAEISMDNKNQIITAIQGLTINKQTVHNQVVEHELVKNKE
jgi:hypothetical protein